MIIIKVTLILSIGLKKVAINKKRVNPAKIPIKK
jgi:hypothetical protein